MSREGIKYRFWNTDYTQQPIMEYGSTDDLKFVARSISKDKMLHIGIHDKKNNPIYEGDKWSPDDASGDVFEVYFRDGKFQTNSPYKLTFGIVVGNIYEHPRPS